MVGLLMAWVLFTIFKIYKSEKSDGHSDTNQECI